MSISKGQKIAAVSAMVARWRIDVDRLTRLFGNPNPDDAPTDQDQMRQELAAAIIAGDGWLAANKP